MLSGTITITGVEANDNAKQLDERNKGAIFKNCATFTDWIRNINNTQVDHAKYPEVLMSMHNLIECSDLKYLKASGSLWQYYRSDQNVIITNSELFKSKIKLTRTSLVLITQRRLK